MRQALSFLTPFGGGRSVTPAAVAWFPVVGLLIGAALGGIWWSCQLEWPPGVVAGIVVACDLAFTGMLHMDGLVDTADGIFLHGSPARRLEVMARSDVGAYGVAAGAAALILRWAALVAVRPDVLLLAGIWAGSRGLMGLVTSLTPYARAEGGLASAFLPARGSGAPGWIAGALGGVLALGATLAWRPLAGGVALAAGLAAGLGVAALARRRLGGFTGDVLGAAGVVMETVALVVAAGRW